jgi:hypothetical protein
MVHRASLEAAIKTSTILPGARMGEGMYGYALSLPRYLQETNDEIRTPAAVTPGGKNPPYPLEWRLGESQSRSVRHWEGIILDLTGTRNPPLSCPIRSQSLYWLCYRCSSSLCNITFFSLYSHAHIFLNHF